MRDYLGIILITFGYFIYSCMVKRFCKVYLKISKLNEILFVCFYLCGIILIDRINKYFANPGIVFDLLDHILFFGLIFLLFRGDGRKKILVASILVAITDLLENFLDSFLSIITLFWLHTVKDIPAPIIESRASEVTTCISLLAMALAVCWPSKHFTSVFYCKTGKWYVTLAIPLLSAALVVDVANWGAGNGILVRSGGNMRLYFDQIFSYTGMCVLTALLMSAVGFYVFGMSRIYLEQEKNSQYHLQVTAYKMLEEQYSQSERLRHDLKNHLVALSGMLEERDWEKMENYLKDMAEGADLGSGEEATGNRTVDVLLHQKKKAAESRNILWECDVQIPQNFCVNEFDLCVLFGNILDNAVEGCEGTECDKMQHRFVKIQARPVKKCFLLEVKNSADLKEKYRVGSTEKGNPQEHGIGLLNISDVVQKYHGVMNIESKDNVFSISVLIPLVVPHMT